MREKYGSALPTVRPLSGHKEMLNYLGANGFYSTMKSTTQHMSCRLLWSIQFDHRCRNIAAFNIVFIKRALLTFSSIGPATRWLNVERGTFWTSGLRVKRMWGIREKPIRWLAKGFLLAPHWHIWPISYHFESFSWFHKRFRPPIRLGYDDNSALEAMA